MFASASLAAEGLTEEVTHPQRRAMDHDDRDDRGARPQSAASVDDALDQLGKEKHRIDTLYRTIQSQLAAQRASLTAGDVGEVLGHITRGGDCLKEAAEYLSGLTDTDAQGGVTEGDGSGRTAVAAVEGPHNAAHGASMAVAVVSDSKRARLDGHSDHPAAAAASGGGVSGVSEQDEQSQNEQHHNHQQQVVCGACLCSLEGPLVCEMAYFLTTIEATVLCLLNKDINSKADYTANTSTTTEGKTDDAPFGIYRNLTIAKEECETWANLNQPTRARLQNKLGNVTTARIAWPIDDLPRRGRSSGRSGGRLVVGCLAASKSSLEELHITGSGRYGSNPDRLPDVVFPKLRLLDTSFGCRSYFRESNWTFPSLVDLRVSTTTDRSLPDVTHIVRSAPQLRTLTTANNSWDKIDGRGSDWCEFASALGQCPHLTTIRGLAIGGIRGLPDLQKALDTHWGKEENRGVKKTIEFQYDNPTISCTFGDETRPLHTFLTWARRVGVSIEWRHGGNGTVGCIRMDCSKGASSSMAPPAVRGPVADVVKQMASQTEIVDLYLGGSRLHDSWKDLLHFPAADMLSIVDTADPQEVIESIPKWLLEVDEAGNNVRLPKIDYLDTSMGFVGDEDAPPAEAWHLPAAPNALTTLLGSLRMVTSVCFNTSSLSAVCESLPHISVDKLDTLEVRVGSHLTALPAPTPQYTLPSVHRLVVSTNNDVVWPAMSKAAALSCMRFASLTHAHKAEFEFHIASDQFDFYRDYGELEGGAGDEDEDDDEDAAWEREMELRRAMEQHGKGCMRALATECYEVVKGGYQLTDVDVGCDVEYSETTMQLVSYGRLQLKVLAKGAIAGGEDRGVMTD
ncbi:unnamed protein product [Vitrella brassicaformis CCMP3155]|uniref:Uncharacterized protein n=1 Tax=Vitrella brassicaformis (strain CCMP3155) TaxID=1169540 RepID=A0A0G4FBG2_VITBC|nr:unnamed protein product [Vitrella brassicaformis CCMP3155]|eukprot:CEM09964.1 unnamed protein product [Vitrella brassicaformis CCMP3155]